jgi:hypothetical protein
MIFCMAAMHIALMLRCGGPPGLYLGRSLCLISDCEQGKSAESGVKNDGQIVDFM